MNEFPKAHGDMEQLLDRFEKALKRLKGVEVEASQAANIAATLAMFETNRQDNMQPFPGLSIVDQFTNTDGP